MIKLIEKKYHCLIPCLQAYFSTNVVVRTTPYQSQLLKYIQPYKLTITNSSDMPKLYLNPEKQVIENWWSTKPFMIQPNQKMLVPIFAFDNSTYIGKQIQLPQEIFNCPLRRDLLHRLYDYRSKLNKYRTHTTRNRAMTAGSGIKMRAQKKTGRARMGDKRAPHLRKGGKAHGAKPRVYSYHLNSKIKLKALKVLLTAKLFEGKIRIVDSEKIAEPKTKILNNYLKQLIKDQRSVFCIITGQQVCNNFYLAQQNLKNVLTHSVYNLDVLSLFKADRILITTAGLQQLIESINKTTYLLFKQRNMPSLDKQQQSKTEEQFDTQKPYEFKFKILAQYMDQYKKIKQEHPQLLKNQLQKVRKISL